MKKTSQTSQQQVKLDQIMKVLFKLSKKVIVDLLNGLFNDNFSSENVTIDYSNGGKKFEVGSLKL